MSASVAEVAGGDQDRRERGREDDRDPRRAAAGQDAPEGRGQRCPARHPVEQPRGHDHVDQRAVGDANRAIAAKTFVLIASGPSLHDLEQRAVGGGERVGRHGHARDQRHGEVDDAGDRQAAEQGPRVVALGSLGLLGDVDGVLEADQRVEGEAGAGEDRERAAPRPP